MDIRQKVLDHVTTMVNQKFEPTKEEIFYRSVEFGQDELREIQSKFQELEKALSHLVLFDELFKKSFDSIHDQFPRLHHFMETNYTQEEYDKMLPNASTETQQKQNKRYQLLRKLALAYTTNTNKQKESNN